MLIRLDVATFHVELIGVRRTYNKGNMTKGSARIKRPMSCSGRYQQYTTAQVIR